MTYKIFKIVAPSSIKYINEDGYNPKAVPRYTLEELGIHGVEDSHLTMEDAVAEIENNKSKLEFLELTIIPFFSIPLQTS